MLLKCFGSSSAGNCYALMNEDEILILDAGVNFKTVQRGIDYRLADIEGVLLTHSHRDHSRYSDDFLRYGIPVFKPYEGGEQSKRMGGFKVYAFPVYHDETPCRGYLIWHDDIGWLLYMTDLAYCEYTFKSYNVNHMLIEANYGKKLIGDDSANRDHVIRGHCEISTALEIVRANMTESLQTLLFCHLSHLNSDADYFIEEGKKVAGNGVYVACAESGLSLELTRKRG